ncbi:MAG TPA: hypothetical protein VM165_16865 [Planctomycetaceae bacterium]|nr:hypothetical protein [Planctomycetaceae bacterium]
MVDGYPSDDELRAADIIVLFDESAPDWSLPIYAGPKGGKKSVVTIGINVDSFISGVVAAWLERVHRLRQP